MKTTKLLFIGELTKKLIVFLALQFFVASSCAETLIGRVVGISDGDTITVLDSNNKQTKIRLNEIDTPEMGQPYGAKSKQGLSDLIYEKTVTIQTQSKDRYGRTLGRVYLDVTDINSEMIKRGLAWVYRQYSRDESLLLLESAARLNRIGLWGLPESQRIPPWEWRRDNKRNQNSKLRNNLDYEKVKKINTSKDGFVCGGKRKCSQMINCSEAIFYLETCGLPNLDGNKNGIPCESICK